jgi:hypothetical protein
MLFALLPRPLLLLVLVLLLLLLLLLSNLQVEALSKELAAIRRRRIARR